MQGAILLRGLRFHARHGVAEQERRVGNEFTVDLRLETDLGRAAQTDRVDDTVDYGAVHRAVAQEMATPSRLLEHAAARLARRLLRDIERTTLSQPGAAGLQMVFDVDPM